MTSSLSYSTVIQDIIEIIKWQSMDDLSTLHQKIQVWGSQIPDLILEPSPIAKIADEVLKLSDIYTQIGDHSKIWNNSFTAQAYLSYFFPLNIIRLLPIFKNCLDTGFLNGIERLIDFGSGPGTTDFAFVETGFPFKDALFIETSTKAISAHQELLKKLSLLEHPDFLKMKSTSRNWNREIPKDIGQKDIVVMAYSLNEIQYIPADFLKAGAIIILEPSTRAAARNLQQQRMILLQNGFHIWAPCTHHNDCPLLKNSKTDWCHNRIHIQKPKSILNIEKKIPIKNDSLTYSYLCLNRSAPSQKPNQARIIGDTLFERGKVKQAICRNESREFLTWLTRNGEPEVIPRGSLIEIPMDHEIKGNEIRLKD